MKRIDAVPRPDLGVSDLRVALALASCGTTARAATVLHLSQPAVSRALLSLEERLGVQLFERTARGLVPTDAGKRLAAEASQLLIGLVDLERRLREPAARPRRLRLVCECYTAYHWLPSALARLRTSLPGLELVLRIEHTSEPLPALLDGDIDVALLTSEYEASREIEVKPLFADEVVFVVGASHPLAKKKTLTRADLKAHKILTSQVPPREQSWFMTAVFGRRQPRLSFEILPLTEAIIDAARCQMGIAVMSEWIAQPHLARGDVLARRLSSGALRRPWRLAWRREVGDTAERLLVALRESERTVGIDPLD